MFAAAMLAATFAATLVATLATVATFPMGNTGTVQVSACAREAANTDTASAIPAAALMRRPRQRAALADPIGFTDPRALTMII